MSYTVLARKYRPQTFDDLVGQPHVSKTLQNAITYNRIAHAFLFTGARGVGKTTSARILAKSLNCEKGPTPTPCNLCTSCVHITQGTDMDVLEMDGASHNSVDDVRRLQETIPFAPAGGQFRILIIDEVHMLSQGAFNALLKTLEEPPAHIKFIFATTEVHKVPITIRSRCQRFDFRLLTETLIIEQLRKVLSQESIKASDDALCLIAKEAQGSMRDALTLTDLMVAQQHEVIDGAFVASVLGVADRVAVSQLTQGCLQGDAKNVFETANRLLATGIPPLHLAKQMADFIKHLVVLQVSSFQQSAAFTHDEVEQWRNILSGIDNRNTQRLFFGVASLIEEVGRSLIPDTVLEMGLVRLASQPSLVPIADLLSEVKQLKSALRHGVPSPKSVATTSQAKAYDPSMKPPTASKNAKEQSISWEAVVNRIRENKPALSAILEHAVPMRCEGSRWEIGFPQGSFFCKQAQSAESVAGIHEAIATFGGPAIEIIITEIVPAEVSSGPVSIASEQRSAAEAARDKLRADALSHPAVIEAVKVFATPDGPPQVTVHVDDV